MSVSHLQSGSLDRIPPHNLEAEMALLGSLLVDREYIALVAPIVKASDFYAHVHETIYGALLELHDTDKPTDKISVAEALRTRDQLDKVGGLSYLSSLMDSVQTAGSAVYYARVIAEKSQLRRLIHVAGQISMLGYEAEEDVAGATLQAEALLRGAIADSAVIDTGTPLLEAVLATYRELDAAAMNAKPVGITTPWPHLDSAIGRFYPGEMPAIAGAPGSGKSIAVTQLAEHIAANHGAVALFALEMGMAATVRRMLAKRAGVSTRHLRSGKLIGKEWERLSEAMGALSTMPLRIFDRVPRKGTHELRRGLQHMALTAPAVGCIVDHANFLTDAAIGDARSSKHDRLDRMYQELLAIATEFNVLMVLVQHLNRDGMTGTPTLANLRDGGNLEGHAHAVIFTHRPDPQNDPRRGQFIVAKSRESRTGVLEMTFDPDHLCWREASDLDLEETE